MPDGRALRSGRRRHAVPRRDRRDLPEHRRSKLLRVLQDGRIPARRRQRDDPLRTCESSPPPIADLDELVKAGRFREDLFYRAERLSRSASRPCATGRRTSRCWWITSSSTANQKLRKSIRSVSPDGMSVLHRSSMARQHPRTGERRPAHDGRGRERRRGTRRRASGAPWRGRRPTRGRRRTCGGSPVPPPSWWRSKLIALDALAKTGGNVTHAAKALGTSRATLQSKMKAYGLRDPAKSK